MPKTLSTATVDRLLRHAHVVLTEGTSLGLSEATAGRGVVPVEYPTGEISCPRTGTSPVRQQGDQLTAHREIPGGR